MKRYKFALVDVDTQNDFMDPKGSLYMPGAVDIIPNLERLFRWAGKYRVPVISTVDAHVPDDPEFREFLPHCVVGTWGHQKISATSMSSCRRSRPDEVYEELNVDVIFRDWPQIIFEKRTYNVFDNPNIERFLQDVLADIFIVCGVATDYCVKAMMDRLLDLSKIAWLVTDGVATVNPAAGRGLLEDFRRRGARLVNTEAVLSQKPE